MFSSLTALFQRPISASGVACQSIVGVPGSVDDRRRETVSKCVWKVGCDVKTLKAVVIHPHPSDSLKTRCSASAPRLPVRSCPVAVAPGIE